MREYLRSEIEHKGIFRCRPGAAVPAKAPAEIYTWQFYLRRVMYDPKFIKAAAEMLVEKLDLKDKQLGACEDAGVPLACAISYITDTPMLSIKKQRKSYGLLNFIEGPITFKPVVLIDDLAGSQTTLMNAQSILESFHVPVADQYATLVNKTQATHDVYLDKKLVSLFTCDDFALTWEEYVAKYGKEPEFGFLF
jgi:orotate phosphoribosyltransferase